MMKLSLSGSDLEKFEQEFKDILELKERIDEIPTTQVINVIMAGAVKMGASDIHLETQETATRLRYRIDGVLQDIGNIPTKNYNSILSRIKMMGEMKINIRDIAQDGHFSVDLDDGGRIDIRINIIPGNFGESITMRLLNKEDATISIEALGMRDITYEKIKKQLTRPHGMILTTGPTGSGKTTSLYAFVNTVNTPNVKIITIEDPIEYQINGILQTQVSNNKDYSFGQGLRAIVRQDPDVILVGEIRDEETASVAIDAALTGHLVFSTLHTNNAPASIPRLIEMGIKPSLISSAANCFIAQRLLRKICPHCRKKYEPAKETLVMINKILSSISPKSKIKVPKETKYLYRAVGCIKCKHIGYKGRIGIFEVLIVSEKIKDLILDMEGELEINQQAVEEGMITMTQDGILKAAEGETSMEEVWRVVGQVDFPEDI